MGGRLTDVWMYLHGCVCREGRLVAAKLRRMLERKIDLWDPEEVFELMPTLMKVSLSL